MINLTDLNFDRPNHLQASLPPEVRGKDRDDVRLLVSQRQGHSHTHFSQLANFLDKGDVLVINDSATLAASLPASGAIGPFILNLSTRYGPKLWLAEPRVNTSTPGPLPLTAGETIRVAGVKAKVVASYPGINRLWFIQFASELDDILQTHGEPIRYGYVKEPFPLESYQTIFATKAGSAEMPSAARPFSQKVLKTLSNKGVQIARLTLHTGVSSLDIEGENLEEHVLYSEPFQLKAQSAAVLNQAKASGQRIIAVGTTVVRVLETSWDGHAFVAQEGFTGRFIRPGHYASSIDGLLTGLHDPKASHLAMLYAIAGKDLIRAGYQEAVEKEYLWHEFGDSHLILP